MHYIYVCVILSTVTSGLVMSLVYTQYHAGYYRRMITTSIYIYTHCFKHYIGHALHAWYIYILSPRIHIDNHQSKVEATHSGGFCPGV